MVFDQHAEFGVVAGYGCGVFDRGEKRREEIRNALYGITEHGTRTEKTGIALVLASSGDANSVPHLNKLSCDTDEVVAQEDRGAAIAAGPAWNAVKKLGRIAFGVLALLVGIGVIAFAIQGWLAD